MLVYFITPRSAPPCFALILDGLHKAGPRGTHTHTHWSAYWDSRSDLVTDRVRLQERAQTRLCVHAGAFACCVLGVSQGPEAGSTFKLCAQMNDGTGFCKHTATRMTNLPTRKRLREWGLSLA